MQRPANTIYCWLTCSFVSFSHRTNKLVFHACEAGMQLLNSKSFLEQELGVVKEQCFDLKQRLESSERKLGTLQEKHMSTVKENLDLNEKYENISERQHEVTCDLQGAKQDLVSLRMELQQEKSASLKLKQQLASLTSEKSASTGRSKELFIEAPKSETSELQPASENEYSSRPHPEELDDIL
jgi:chromosome segregation ATPase